MNSACQIRPATRKDCAQLLQLMRQLADFEGYLEQFFVTESDLLERGFERDDFCALVVEQDGQLVGMLIYYWLPFTYDLKPWLFIKELYIDSGFRGQHIGQKLMTKAAQICQQSGGSKMRWDVLADNHKAQHFYQQLGGQAQTDWQGFELSGSALDRLAKGA